MMRPPFPPDEAARLLSLRALNILDTPPEEIFDRITRLAQNIFNVPIALVSLVDSERQWFKSRQGVTASEAPRDTSFCGHAILGDETFVVLDARTDERFADNPFVTGEPNVRFYAGQPVRAPRGAKVGTLCIIDNRPRRFSEKERKALADLAAILEDALRSEKALMRNLEKSELILRAAGEGIYGVDREGRANFVNPAAAAMLGYEADELIGKAVHRLCHHAKTDGSPYPIEECPIFATFRDGRVHKAVGETCWRKDGKGFPVSLTSTPIIEDGQPAGAVVVFQDITGQKLVADIEKTFGQFVTPEVVQFIMAHRDYLNQSERRNVTVMFADVRGFTEFAGRVSPEEVVSALNTVFRCVFDAIQKESGILNKIMGDGMLACFGAPLPLEDHAAAAARAALAARESIESLSRARRAEGLEALQIGIGINTGTVIAGCLGTKERLEYSVIGNTVNIAARIQGQAMPGQILLGPSTAERLAGRFGMRDMGRRNLKGVPDGILISELLKA
ncbi:MAG: adenylate/guanylate cyclase domain-containing protein [Elusimicrobiota bacterium]